MALDSDTQELFDVAQCFACFAEDTSQVQLMRLALLAQIAHQFAPGLDLDPQSLFARGKCYACVGASEADVMELALLNLIASNIGNVTVVAANKFGVGDPNGVVTPDYIGQFYTDTAGTGGFDDLWQAYGLGMNSWNRWI